MGGIPLFNVGIQNRQGGRERQSFLTGNWTRDSGSKTQYAIH